MIFGEHIIVLALLTFVLSAAVAMGIHGGIVLATRLWGAIQIGWNIHREAD